MYCENCGKEIEKNSEFCSYCGAKIKKEIGSEMAYIQGDVHRKSENLKIDIPKEIGETERVGEQKKIKKGNIAVATVVVIALAVLIGVWLHNALAGRLAEQLDLGNRYLEEMDYE